MNDGTANKKRDLIIKSKAYKKAVLKAKAVHRLKTIKKLSNAKIKNPKYYWSVLNCQINSTHRKSNNKISLNDFYTGFKELSGTNSHGEFTNSADDFDDNTSEIRGVNDKGYSSHVKFSNMTHSGVLSVSEIKTDIRGFNPLIPQIPICVRLYIKYFAVV